MQDTIKHEDGTWEDLRIEIRVSLDWQTEIQTKVLNTPSLLFDFFEKEELKLQPKEYLDLKKRKGRKFLKFLKEIGFTDTRTLVRIVDNLGLERVSKVEVAYIYDMERYG